MNGSTWHHVIFRIITAEVENDWTTNWCLSWINQGSFYNKNGWHLQRMGSYKNTGTHTSSCMVHFKHIIIHGNGFNVTKYTLTHWPLWSIVDTHNHVQVLNNQVDGLVQDCSNSITHTLELLQSFTKPSKYFDIMPSWPGTNLTSNKIII